MKNISYFVFAIIFAFQCVKCTQNTKKEPIISLYTGWWIYGEGAHIFKDEATLEEWDIIFPNEDMDELEELYLAVTEMQYFPMECLMQGYLDSMTLSVIDFEITYIQGCGEEATN